jgi:hypothetical protein
MTGIRAMLPDTHYPLYYQIDMYKSPSFFRVFSPDYIFFSDLKPPSSSLNNN